MSPSLLLLGHFPPPRGGVAAHLERLRDRLAQASFPTTCVSFGLPDPRHPDTVIAKQTPLACVRAVIRGARLLHYHTDEGDWKSAALLGVWCMLRGQKYVFTVHSFRDRPFLHAAWSRRVVQLAYRRARRVICISENLRTELLHRLDLDPSRVIVIPSFIPPTSAERDAPVPAAFGGLAARCPVIIAFNAFTPTIYQDEDLYGTEIVMDAFAEIASDFPEAGLFMAYMRMDDSPLARRIVERANALGDRVTLVEQRNEPFIPELARCKIFVRSTLNDGGPSLSLLEALSLGIWTAASDAVPRPAECALYHTRDPHHLAGVLRSLLTRVRAGESQPAVTFPDAVDTLLRLYAEV